jgi:Flp pilus assembly protein TadG
MTHRFPRFARRRGTTSVEAAFVLPVFFAFLFAIMQFGHVSMIKHLLQHGCRSAARIGSTEDVSTSTAKAKALEVIGGVIDSQKITLLVKDASVYDGDGEDLPETSEDFAALDDLELTGAEPRQLFVVRAEVNYNDVCLIPLPFTSNLKLSAQAFMRHE